MPDPTQFALRSEDSRPTILRGAFKQAYCLAGGYNRPAHELA
jgi:hypothetical protein